MTTLDRDLLELAAKAIGREIARFDNGHELALGGVFFKDHDPDDFSWNPLTDDGDALRLAVTLSLFDGLEKRASEIAAAAGYDMDPCEATRRAIVMAAADIGRRMP